MNQREPSNRRTRQGHAPAAGHTGRRPSISGAPVSGADALGRRLPLPTETGPLRSDRYVGIFYFLFINFDGPVFDNTRILEAYPDVEWAGESPPWGPFSHPHFWGEPLYGYYKVSDPWVLRRHAHLLLDAGVDFVIFDTTNTSHYPNLMPVIFDTWMELRRAGDRTPQCVFMVNTDAGKRAQDIYESFYCNDAWADLWFQWHGKPLMICDPAEASLELREACTLRKAHWPFTLVNTRNAWHWEAAYPQVYSYVDDPARPEEVNVSVAQNLSADPDAHVTMMNWPDARGRHFHDGALDPDPAAVLRGANFQEQWKRAFELDPEIVFVTGWNEWIACRMERLGKTFSDKGLFCDQYNIPNSRDAEMARGPLGDNFYCQMAANIRRFKGIEPLPPASAPSTIDIEGPLAQWDSVTPEYRDHPLETIPRDFPGCGGLHYTNSTGRNDLDTIKVARDSDTVYFLATTRNPLSPHTGPDWMQLLIDCDLDPASGWEGFNLLARVSPDDSAHVRRWNGACWDKPESIGFSAGEISVQYAILRVILGGTPGLRFEFKWVDNIALPCDILNFYLNGDVAPLGRFRYHYNEFNPN